MPLFLLIIGVVFLVAVVRGNQQDLIDLLKDDFGGQHNFILWVLAIIIIVALGNFKPIRPISNAFLLLVVIVIVIKNYEKGNLFQSFLAQLKAGTS